MNNLAIYQHRVRQINKYQSILKKISLLTNLYLSFVIIWSLTDIYCVIENLLEISNFQITIDLHLTIILWFYLVILNYNIISYIFAIIFNNFSRKWFYFVTVIIIVCLIGFMIVIKHLTNKHNLITLIRNHYSVTDADNMTIWKNMTFKMYCSKGVEKNINISETPSSPESCIKYIGNFLSTIYLDLYYRIIVMFIINVPLLIIALLNILIDYKINLTYTLVKV